MKVYIKERWREENHLRVWGVGEVPDVLRVISMFGGRNVGINVFN